MAMPQPHFNPEKEPTPERKWWSVFERQSEFEHPELEEAQKRRTKELKSASKERGHFWERLFAKDDEPDEIKVIAPKGEKVRKKWRALLRRKSAEQVREFQEQEPETIDSYWLAQLMVAERVLKLHERLEATEPKTRERKETKTELDVLGLLSEKLSDPRISVPDEIEETYQAIITTIEAGDEDVIIEALDLPTINDSTQPESHTRQPEDERSESFQRYGAAVIVALQRAVQKHQPDQPQGNQHIDQQDSVTQTRLGTTGDYTPSDSDTASNQPRPKAARTDHGPAATSTMSPRASEEHRHRPHMTPNVLPHLALTTAIISSEADYRHEDKPSNIAPHTTAVSQHTEVPRITETRPDTSTKTAPANHVDHVIAPVGTILEPNPETSASATPQKRFEHMSMQELLTLARSVPIGGGQYLARAYETGRIDRDGLIAVLKSARRNQDHAFEFKRRSAEYVARKLQPHAPHLAAPHRVSSPPTIEPDTTGNQAQGAQQQPQPETSISAHTTHPYTQKRLSSLLSTNPTTIRHSIRLIVIVTLILVVLWLTTR